MMPLVLGHLLLDQSQDYHLVVVFEIYYMQSERNKKRISLKIKYIKTHNYPKIKFKLFISTFENAGTRIQDKYYIKLKSLEKILQHKQLK